MKFIIIFIILILSFFTTYSDELVIESENRWELFLKNFYSKPDYVKNQTLLSAFYGRSFTDINQNNITNFSDIHNLDFYYGFIRVNEKIKYKDNFQHQGEYVFLSNTSTNFKTFQFDVKGIVTDSWRFGFGLNDGYGVYFLGNKLFLNHSTAFTWIRIDVDYFSGDSLDINFIKRFDERFKFGSLYSAGITYQLYDFINFDINYEHSYYFPNYDFLPWFGSWIFDNVLQRGPELFQREIEAELEDFYPYFKIIYKNLISIITTELRRHNGYFPFSSESTLSYDTFKIGIVLII